MSAEELTIFFLVAFWLAVYPLSRVKRLKQMGVEVKPFLIMYRTAKANGLLDRVVGSTRFWRLFSSAGLFVAIVLAGNAIYFLSRNLASFFLEREGFSRVTLLIPGLTIQSSMMLLYFFLAIPIILIFHEGAHGVVARLEGIRIKSAGVMVVAVLFGGFVEPDDSDFKSAPPVSRMKVLAAGSTANIALSIIILPLVIGTPFLPSALPDQVENLLYHPPQGLLVTVVEPGKPAGSAGLLVGDVVFEVDDKPIRDRGDYEALEIQPGRPVVIGVLRSGRTSTLSAVPISSTGNASKGVIGFGGVSYSRPKFFPEFGLPIPLAFFIFWLCFISYNIGLFNMLPFYPLDGDSYFNALLEQRVRSMRARKAIRVSANIFAIGLLGGNLVTTFITGGLVAV